MGPNPNMNKCLLETKQVHIGAHETSLDLNTETEINY